jgi:hypothetical protein
MTTNGKSDMIFNNGDLLRDVRTKIDDKFNEVDGDIADAVSSATTAISAANDRIDLTGVTAESVADLVLVDTDADVVNLLGFYESGDGGGGVFFWDSTLRQANHNGGTVIDPEHSATPGAAGWWAAENSGTGCWVRNYAAIILPEWFGAKGDGTTDDSGAINAAVLSLPPFGTLFLDASDGYAITGITIPSKSSIRLTGAKLILSGSGTTAITMTGTCDGVEIDHIEIVGDGVISSAQLGIVNSSGQDLTNISIHDNYIHGVRVAISANADLSGSVSDWRIFNNHIKDIVGIDSGQGYGIHTANGSFILIYDNILDNCSRHSIYLAKGYSVHNRVYNNTILNHRSDVASASYRAAILIGRTSHVSVYNNDVVDGYDGGIHVSQDTVGEFYCHHIEVYNNRVVNRKNNVPSIIIGEQMVPDGYYVEHCRVFSNKFYVDAQYNQGADITIFNGRYIDIFHNTFQKFNVESGTVRNIALGHNSFITDDSDCRDVSINNNVFRVDGSPDFNYGVTLAPLLCTGSEYNRVRDNTLAGDNGYPIEYQDFLTNQNLDVVLTYSALYNPPAIDTLEQLEYPITVRGVKLGDAVSVMSDQDLLGVTLSGYVSDVEEVTIVFFNGTGDSVDLGNVTLKAKITRW